MVCHQHVNVNDKLVNIASLQLRPNDIVSFAKAESQKIPAIEKKHLRIRMPIAPVWLERKGAVGKLTGVPGAELIEKQIILRLVIEYFHADSFLLFFYYFIFMLIPNFTTKN